MRVLYASKPDHQEAIERRKRAFMAALALRGETQRSWAMKHGSEQSQVSAVLLGHRVSEPILTMIYHELRYVKRVAPKLLEEVA